MNYFLIIASIISYIIVCKILLINLKVLKPSISFEYFENVLVFIFVLSLMILSLVNNKI